MRVALYYAPAADDPLWRLASGWLGRDAETNAPCDQPDLPGIAEITADARGYGFHATLKPPMRLVEGAGWDAVLDATRAIAANIAPFDLPPLLVGDLHGFIAIRDAEPSAALQALSDACVSGLDALRAPPDDGELARRRRSGLSAAEDANLVRWGYQYVFDTWFFHMTLTRRLSAAEMAIYLPAAEARFTPLLGATRRVSDICVFAQSGPGVPFVVAERVKLAGATPSVIRSRDLGEGKEAVLF